MKKNNILIVAIIAIIIICVGSFYTGMRYGASQKKITNFQRSAGQFGAGQPGQRGQGIGGRNGSGMINGSVIKTDENSITVKMNDGSTKIVFLSDVSSVTKSISGSKEDLSVGENVMINGTANTDGSVVAQFVQIRPSVNPPDNNSASSTPK